MRLDTGDWFCAFSQGLFSWTSLIQSITVVQLTKKLEWVSEWLSEWASKWMSVREREKHAKEGLQNNAVGRYLLNNFFFCFCCEVLNFFKCITEKQKLLENTSTVLGCFQLKELPRIYKEIFISSRNAIAWIQCFDLFKVLVDKECS